MRLFIGIKLDDSVIKKTNNYFKYFYTEGIIGNYTKSSNLHLTLAFLGEIEESKVSLLLSLIDSIELKNLNKIKISKITKFKDMLIYEVEKSRELNVIYDELIAKLEEHSFNTEKRVFYPHITLIRKTNKFIEKEILFESVVNKITLFESKVINNQLIYIPK